MQELKFVYYIIRALCLNNEYKKKVDYFQSFLGVYCIGVNLNIPITEKLNFLLN